MEPESRPTRSEAPADRHPPARVARSRPEERAHLLSAAYDVLAVPLGLETMLAEVARLLVPALADWCIVDVVEDDGVSVRRLIAAHADAANAEGARELEGRFVLGPAPRGPARVMATGKSETHVGLRDATLLALTAEPDHVRALAAVPALAAICVPLSARGRTLGALTLLTSRPDGMALPTDVAIVRVIGHRTALAVEQATLYRRTQRARETAEGAAVRTARLQTVTDALLEAVTASRVAAVILDHGMDALGASAGAVLLLTEDGEELEVVAAAGFPDELVERHRRFPVDTTTPFADALRTRAPVFLPSAATRAARYPEFGRLVPPHEAEATVPLGVRDQAFGVLGFGFPDPRRFADEERSFMVALGRQCALALERARLYEAEQRARDEAEAANRAKDAFLATLSHELRTPLAAVLGWVRLLRAGRLDPASASRALETIERNARIQGQLIEDLLDISRIVAGKFRLETELLDFRGVVEAALEAARPTAQTAGIRLDVRLDDPAAVVSGDPARLQQVVANLLTNALKFTPPGGSVAVHLGRVGAQVVLAVGDTGEGIRAEFLPRLFDSFTQQDSSAARHHAGLGLGLAIVRHLVELHGGTVSADSAGEGRGATFTVRLPVAAALVPAEAAPPESADAVPPVTRVLEGLRVLVVDDEPDALRLICTMLEHEGADVATVVSAREARVAVEQFQPAVLVCDIAMPGETGYSLIRDIRARDPEHGGAIPAIALTAYASAQDRERALAAGFHRHVTKPVEPETLVGLVTDLAGRGAPRRAVEPREARLL